MERSGRALCGLPQGASQLACGRVGPLAKGATIAGEGRLATGQLGHAEMMRNMEQDTRDIHVQRKFQPGLVGTIAAMAGVAALASLGLWQLDRADQKTALADAFEAGSTAPVDYGDVSRPGTEDSRYQAVRVGGRYLSDRQVLVDAMIVDGQPGYHVLTPLDRGNGRPLVMVNRGWVPAGADRSVLPDVTVATGKRRLDARVAPLARPGMRLDGGDAGASGWPRVLLFPTRDDIAGALGAEVAPGQLLLDPDQADGYVRRWQPAGFGPERHLGYAVQWFALAATLFVIYLVVNFKRTPSS